MISLAGVTKVFYTDDLETHALDGIHLDVARASSSRSPALRAAASRRCSRSSACSIRRPRASTRSTATRSPRSRLPPAPRSATSAIGFIFQAFNLIGDLTVLQNVELPLTYREKMSADERRKAALHALERVGMSHRVNHHPAQLSGGQQQRVAVARPSRAARDPARRRADRQPRLAQWRGGHEPVARAAP